MSLFPPPAMVRHDDSVAEAYAPRGAAVTLAAAKDALWRAGVLLWKVRDHQLLAYEFLSGADGVAHTQRLAYIHRQFGKSHLSELIAVEVALQKKRARVTIVAPTQKMMRAILIPNMATLLEDCPADLKPTFNALDNVYTFPSTGSTIRIDGADSGGAENLRGRANDLVIIDEAGFIRDLKALIHDIILPSFLTTNGRLIAITTPPKTAGHYCAQLRHRLSAAGAFLKFRLSDNVSITPEVRARWAEECGGADSATYLREYECEEITDATAAVVPEWNSGAILKLVKDVPAPDPYVSRLVGMDLGWSDPTALVFGYYDFKTARLMIQDELVLRRARIEEIARETKRVEELYWPGQRPYTRISDVDPMVLAELSAAHGLSFRPVSKVLKEQMVNELRTWVRQERIIVDPRCWQLIAQLEAAVWTSSRRTFEHTEAFGHFDLVDALVYLLQAIPRQHNPYPTMPEGVGFHTHHYDPADYPDHNLEPLRQLFPSPWRRR